MEREANTVRFMESIEHKIELMMRTGDICDDPKKRTDSSVIDKAIARIDAGECADLVTKEMNVQKRTIYFRRRRKAQKLAQANA